MGRTVLSWSGGKDAAYALSVLYDRDVEIVELLTTISEATDRSTMHGVRRPLYRAQAGAIGESLRFVPLPPEPSNETYEAIMNEVLADYRDRGVDRIAFADLYLEDVRTYREDRIDGTGLEAAFPLWGRDTDRLARAFLDAGFRATVVAVDGDRLEQSAVGRPYDRPFLDSLPEGVDSCGENGSFHTFVHDGPIFSEPVPIAVGETVTRPVGDGEFHYCELRLSDEPKEPRRWGPRFGYDRRTRGRRLQVRSPPRPGRSDDDPRRVDRAGARSRSRRLPGEREPGRTDRIGHHRSVRRTVRGTAPR